MDDRRTSALKPDVSPTRPLPKQKKKNVALRTAVIFLIIVAALTLFTVIRGVSVPPAPKAVVSDEPCYVQMVDWNGMPLLADINTDLREIYQEEQEVINGIGPVKDVQRRWTALAAHALTGLKHPPPTCLPGARTQWNTAMTDYLAAAGSYSKQDTQDNSLIKYQIQGATAALRQFTILMSSIVD